MNNRQSGAAHAPMPIVILLLFIAIGSGVANYLQETEKAELKKQVAQAEADRDAIQGKEALIQDYIAEIGKVINKPGPYLGRNGNAELYNGATIEYPGLMDPKVVKQVMDDTANNAGVSQASSLENLLGSMVTRINQMTKRVKDVELERDKVPTDKSTGDQRYTALEGQAARRRRRVQQPRAGASGLRLGQGRPRPPHRAARRRTCATRTRDDDHAGGLHRQGEEPGSDRPPADPELGAGRA